MMIRYNGTPIPAGECKELGIPLLDLAMAHEESL